MRYVFSLLLLFSSTPIYANFDCAYDPLTRLEQCMDASEEYLGRAQPDDKGNLAADPWFAKKIVNDVTCHNLGVSIYKDKGKKVKCEYVKEELGHRCSLVEEPKKEED